MLSQMVMIKANIESKSKDDLKILKTILLILEREYDVLIEKKEVIDNEFLIIDDDYWVTYVPVFPSDSKSR